MSTRHLVFWPPKVPRHLTVPETSLWVNAEVSARRYPTRPCLSFYDSVTTYAEFQEQAERLAGFLQTVCGVRRGDRVGLYLQNSPQFVVGYYAILRADAMVVPVNPMLLGVELEHVIVACYADALTARTDLAVPPWVSAPRAAVSGNGVHLWRDALDRGLAPGPHLAGPDD